MLPLLSIVIPTRDRAALLLRVIEALLNQAADIENQIEIIIVDDGSTEDVETPLKDMAARRGQDGMIHYIHQSPKGPAAARNLGIREARGELVLFLGDDILASPGLLRAHVLTHTEEHPGKEFAVLGMADLAPEFLQTPFAEWWRHWNFRYWLLLEEKRLPDYSFFYTNNLSLKRDFLLQHGMFDESFRYAAYEDGELGARLIKQGLQLVFRPEAKADHYHEINLRTACQRMVIRGKSYDLFIEKTGLLGLSRIWMAIGAGPWMTPAIIRPLFRLADWLQTRVAVGLVYTLVLMYCFRVGRKVSPSIQEIS
jgi:glycosyltransferase involved in cell wall biosynthesis